MDNSMRESDIYLTLHWIRLQRHDVDSYQANTGPNWFWNILCGVVFSGSLVSGFDFAGYNHKWWFYGKPKRSLIGLCCNHTRSDTPGPLSIHMYESFHYNGVTMSAMASQITSLTIVYSTIYSGADQRKHQSSASLTFVTGIHRWPMS